MHTLANNLLSIYSQLNSHREARASLTTNLLKFWPQAQFYELTAKSIFIYHYFLAANASPMGFFRFVFFK